MKLSLRATIKKHGDPILDFFESMDFLVLDYSSYEDLGPCWCIQNKQDDPPAFLYYYPDNRELSLEEAVGWQDDSLLFTNLYAMLEDLIQQINRGDLSKLPELGETYLAFQELAN